MLLPFVSSSLLLPAGRSVRVSESSKVARSSASHTRNCFPSGPARPVVVSAGSATQVWLASPKVAARAGTVEALLEADSSTEEAKANLTPLMDAIMSENVELVKALIETGASLEAEDASSIPPLYLAVIRGNVEVVEALIDAGASLERRLISSPLGFAILSGVTLELAHTFAPGRAAAQPRGNMHVTKVVLEASLAADPLGVAISLTLLANLLLVPYYVVFVLDGGARLATGALALMYVKVVMVG